MASTSSSRKRTLLLRASTVLLVAGAVTMRLWLVGTGVVYGDTPVRLATLTVALIVAAAMLAWLPKSGEPIGNRLGAIAAATATVAAVYTLGEVAFPNTPAIASATACRGAVLAGAHYFGETPPNTGVNARSGATTAAPQVERFASGCTIGFDGYCVGEAIDDGIPGVGLPDQRWLLVHDRGDTLIADARILDQSPESKLGSHPAKECRTIPGTTAPPGSPKLIFGRGGKPRTAAVYTESDGAAMVGYAMQWLTAPVGHTYPLITLNPSNRPSTAAPYFKLELTLDSLVSSLPGGTGAVELAAEPCLAADVPFGPPAIATITFVDGKPTNATLDTAGPNNRANVAALATLACAGPP